MMPVRPDHDRILVVGGAANTLDLLRLATVRSDDVVLVAAKADAAIRRYVDRFAVELRVRCFNPSDLAEVSAVLVCHGDPASENEVVRQARRREIPVHVSGRLLVSDFSLIEMLERKPSSIGGHSRSGGNVAVLAPRRAADSGR